MISIKKNCYSQFFWINRHGGLSRAINLKKNYFDLFMLKAIYGKMRNALSLAML
jgi:hypothetical protein